MTRSNLLYTDYDGWKAVSKAVDAGRSYDTLLPILGEVGVEHFRMYMTLVENFNVEDVLEGRATALNPEIDAAKSASLMISMLEDVLLARFRYLKTSWGSGYLQSDDLTVWKAQFETTLRFLSVIPAEMQAKFYSQIRKSLPDDVSLPSPWFADL